MVNYFGEQTFHLEVRKLKSTLKGLFYLLIEKTFMQYVLFGNQVWLFG